MAVTILSKNAQQGCFGRKRIEPPPNRLSNGLPRGCQAAAIVAADDFSCPKQRPPKPVLDKSGSKSLLASLAEDYGQKIDDPLWPRRQSLPDTYAPVDAIAFELPDKLVTLK